MTNLILKPNTTCESDKESWKIVYMKGILANQISETLIYNITDWRFFFISAYLF